MSLKAKLEAVIYAAEEPVTLAQLASLFAEDAFAWKAEQDALQLELARSVELAAEADGVLAPEQADSTRELVDLIVAVEQPEESETAELEEIAPEAAESVSEAVEFEGAESEVAEPGTIESGRAEPEVAESEVSQAEATSTEAAGMEAVEVDVVQAEAGDVAISEVDEADEVAVAVVDPEVEAKRLQRQREREVREILRGILDELIAEYAGESRGLEIREIAGGFRMGTKPEIHDAVRIFVKSLKPPMKLSLPALETLAVIAYKQPVTAPEVGEIRGVDSGGVLGSLMSRKLIATAGRKQVIGRPMLYKTTKEFLLRFGLKDLNELPSMEEFEKMAAMELSEGEDEDGSSDAASVTGDLFAESETATVPAGSTTDLEADAPETKVETEYVPTDKTEADMAVNTPTAEPSEEAAEAQAPVERPDAEEVEVER